MKLNKDLIDKFYKAALNTKRRCDICGKFHIPVSVRGDDGHLVYKIQRSKLCLLAAVKK